MPDYLNYFLVSPESSILYDSSYDVTWVAISVALACLGAYSSLKSASRIAHASDSVSKLIWIVTSTITLGFSIWSMHFIGMLALSLPCAVYYDPVITILSILPGLLAAAVSMTVVWQANSTKSLFSRSILLGLGIGTMHYTGMMAMQIEGFVRYNPYLFVLSIVVAIVLSYLALFLKIKQEKKARSNYTLVAVTLGLAVSCMHYIAMFAAYFVKGDASLLPDSLLTTNTLTLTVALITFFMALIVLIMAALSKYIDLYQQLRQSELCWQFALEGDGVWDWYPKEGKVICSDHYRQILGFEPEEVTEDTSEFIDRLHPDDKELAISAFIDSIKNDRVIPDVEFRMRAKDGNWRWLANRGRVVERDKAGKAVRVLGTSRDITKRKTLEQQLLVDSVAFESSEGAMITDAQLNIIRVNHAFTQMTGYSAEEIIGQKAGAISSGRHGKQFYQRMWNALLTKGRWQGEIWDQHKDGNEFPVWLSINCVRDSTGIITNYVGFYADLSERIKSEEKIYHLAFYDQLTDLPNRQLLLDRITQTIRSSVRSGKYSALILIDLDNFKILNDTHGHEIGDKLIINVAEILKSEIRDSDTLSRPGGDEFILCLDEISTDKKKVMYTAEQIAEKIRMSINQRFDLGVVSHQVTASIGVNLFLGKAISAEELLKQTELAMYKSKDTGRNSIRFYDPAMEIEIFQRLSLERSLQKAIEENQFLLHYQGQVGVEHQLKGAEVLVRWQHPEKGMIPPGEFIPVAEETGLIINLGKWILETACKQLAKWAQMPELSELSISVNVSSKQFIQNDFVDDVIGIVESTGAKPERLKLELTESLLAEDIENIIIKMTRLKDFGLQLSLDDFGTGYSSLTYLKRLPLDQLKIDQSFVRDVLTNKADAAIARTIIELSKRLDKEVIAEGVEHQNQQDYLAALGCFNYQGYLYGRPVPLDDFEVIARKNHEALSS